MLTRSEGALSLARRGTVAAVKLWRQGKDAVVIIIAVTVLLSVFLRLVVVIIIGIVPSGGHGVVGRLAGSLLAVLIIRVLVAVLHGILPGLDVVLEGRVVEARRQSRQVVERVAVFIAPESERARTKRFG
jgi:hypothetical protein